jgi:hypothetical protein
MICDWRVEGRIYDLGLGEWSGFEAELKLLDTTGFFVPRQARVTEIWGGAAAVRYQHIGNSVRRT